MSCNILFMLPTLKVLAAFWLSVYTFTHSRIYLQVVRLNKSSVNSIALSFLQLELLLQSSSVHLLWTIFPRIWRQQPAHTRLLASVQLILSGNTFLNLSEVKTYNPISKYWSHQWFHLITKKMCPNIFLIIQMHVS